jgi:hypothetical protein
MKNVIFLLIMIPTIYATAICHRCTESGEIQIEENLFPCRKRYIKPEQIAFFADKIVITIDEGDVVEAIAVRKDDWGFYIEEEECDERYGYRWECLICHYCNAFWDKCCIRCNRDRKGDKCK